MIISKRQEFSYLFHYSQNMEKYLKVEYIIICLSFCIKNSLNIYPNQSAVNPLSANSTKWSNTPKQFVGKLPTTCLSLFDHFVELALKVLSEVTHACISFYQLHMKHVNRLTTVLKLEVSFLV